MAKGEFFLETRSEEIPARMLAPAVEELTAALFEGLVARGLTPREALTAFTPRRLAVCLKGIPGREPDREEQVTGPPVSAGLDDAGKPTAAAVGFARRCGVEARELQRVETPKGEYLAAVVHSEGRPATAVLGELVPRVLAGLSWPKTMRWGEGAGPWARPLHGIVALYEGEVVPFSLFGVETGDQTCGHPLFSPKAFKVTGFADYRKKLRRRKIWVDFKQRRQAFQEAAERAAVDLGGTLVQDDSLLDRLVATCGTPGVIGGRFDERYLKLPREVLAASLRDHQSAFTVESDGQLLPVFLTLMDRTDDPSGRVAAGNEWVVEARLADAAFFYGEDRKSPLADKTDALAGLTFHEQLGSYADKSERLARLCRVIGEALGDEPSTDEAMQAAALLKADLTTEMVKEFTSLQGVVGGVYAREDGVDEAVWKAVYEQYLPAGTADPIPSTRCGQIVGLADRIDTLVGIFGIGHVPSGSKDPFGLRRAAQGVVRIALEGGLGLDLDLVAAKAHQGYGGRLKLSGKETMAVWRPFLADRVRYLLGLGGFRHDEIEAALEAGANDLPDLRKRIEAVHAVRREPGFRSVVQAAKRIANILKGADEQSLTPELLAEEAEKSLHAGFTQLKQDVHQAENEGRYEEGLRAMAAFAGVLDRFFVEVLVMDEDIELRNNRIAMLQSIQRVLSRTAELTAIVVERKGADEENG